jgi:hypothetical protein
MIEYMAADHWRSLNDSFMTQIFHIHLLLERQKLAMSCPSRCIKINVSYREKHASAAGWFEPVTNVLTPFLVYCV